MSLNLFELRDTMSLNLYELRDTISLNSYELRDTCYFLLYLFFICARFQLSFSRIRGTYDLIWTNQLSQFHIS